MCMLMLALVLTEQRNTSPKRTSESMTGVPPPPTTLRTISTGVRLAGCAGRSIVHAVALVVDVLLFGRWLVAVTVCPIASLKLASTATYASPLVQPDTLGRSA